MSTLLLPQPRVGVGVPLLLPTGYLFLRRIGKHGAGEWSFPGGAVEFGETLIACGLRETEEEVGLIGRDPVLLSYFSEDFFPDQHWLTFYVLARADGVPRIVEPDKADALCIARPNAFPEPLFPGIAALLAAGLLPDIAG